MLTVNYDRLGVKPGDYVLDMGCGAGRHAYEAARRGARVVALDADDVEVKTTAGLLLAMEQAGDVPAPGCGTTAVGNALKLPFADGAFDRVIASEILEHIPPDTIAIDELARVTRVGGTLGITVPRFGPELLNWALSTSTTTNPAVTSASTASAYSNSASKTPGSPSPARRIRTACTVRTGGSSAPLACRTTPTRSSRRTTSC